MKHSLGELLLQGQAEATQKQGGELESLVTRLEGRILRAREHQESLIYSMKNEQENFQSEVRSTLQSLQQPTSEKIEGNVNNHQGDSSGRGVTLTPVRGMEMGAMYGSPQLGRGPFSCGGFGGGLGTWRYRKLDMPLFDGIDPIGWLMRVDRYFNFYR